MDATTASTPRIAARPQRYSRSTRGGVLAAVLLIAAATAAGHDMDQPASIKAATTTLNPSRAYVVSKSGQLTTFDTSSGAVLGSVATNAWATGLAVNHNDTRAYVINGWIGVITIIDTRTLAVVKHIRTNAQLSSAVIRSDGQRLYVAGSDSSGGHIWVFNTSDNTLAAIVPTGAIPTGLSMDTAGDRLYVTNSQDGTVTVVDTHSATVVATIEVPALPQNAATSLDGKTSYIVSTNRSETDSGVITAIDTGTGKVVGSIPVGRGAAGMVLSSNGSRLVVANTQDDTVFVVDTVRNVVVAKLDMAVTGMAADPRDHRVYLVSEHTMSVLDSNSCLLDAQFDLAGLSGVPFSAAGIALPGEPNE